MPVIYRVLAFINPNPLQPPEKRFLERRSQSGKRSLPVVTLVLLAGIWLLWSTSFAAAPMPIAQQAASRPAKQQEADTKLEPNQVDLKKSRVYIFVDKTGLGHQHGVEGRLSSGTIKLGAVEEGGEFVFDMKSFDADTDAARRYLGLSGSTDSSTRQQVNQNMRAASILNVNQFPTAKFAIKSAAAKNKKSRNGHPLYEFVGEFTLRGRTQPLKFEAEAETKDNMAHIKGQFAMLQTQYGITPFRKALGAVGVADRLVIHGDLWVAVEPEAAATK